MLSQGLRRDSPDLKLNPVIRSGNLVELNGFFSCAIQQKFFRFFYWVPLWAVARWRGRAITSPMNTHLCSKRNYHIIGAHRAGASRAHVQWLTRPHRNMLSPIHMAVLLPHLRSMLTGNPYKVIMATKDTTDIKVITKMDTHSPM